jgi:prephenate dehydratase
MSRPTRRFIGSYHFFIELEINGELDKLHEVISSLDNVTLLGIY